MKAWLGGLLLLVVVTWVTHGLTRPVSPKRFQALIEMPDLTDCALE